MMRMRTSEGKERKRIMILSLAWMPDLAPFKWAPARPFRYAAFLAACTRLHPLYHNISREHAQGCAHTISR